MMDSTDEEREYEIAANQVVRISWGDVLCALEKENDSRAAVQQRFIRDCFDYFFYFVDRIEHYIAIDLVTYEDVEAPLRRYARTIVNQNATFEHYMIAQNYHLALNFFRRFDQST